MDIHIKHSNKRIRIRVNAIRLDGRAQQRLRDDEVRELVRVQELGVGLEELSQEPLDGDKVDRRGIEKVKVDVDETGLL